MECNSGVCSLEALVGGRARFCSSSGWSRWGKTYRLQTGHWRRLFNSQGSMHFMWYANGKKQKSMNEWSKWEQTVITRQDSQLGSIDIIIQTDSTHFPSIAFDEFLRLQLFQRWTRKTMEIGSSSLKTAFHQLVVEMVEEFLGGTRSYRENNQAENEHGDRHRKRHEISTDIERLLRRYFHMVAEKENEDLSQRFRWTWPKNLHRSGIVRWDVVQITCDKGFAIGERHHRRWNIDV